MGDWGKIDVTVKSADAWVGIVCPSCGEILSIEIDDDAVVCKCGVAIRARSYFEIKVENSQFIGGNK